MSFRSCPEGGAKKRTFVPMLRSTMMPSGRVVDESRVMGTMPANTGGARMYGTVARMRVRPGMEAKLKEEMAQYERVKIPVFVSTMGYHMDRDPNDCMAVAFKDKKSYVANAPARPSP